MFTVISESEPDTLRLEDGRSDHARRDRAPITSVSESERHVQVEEAGLRGGTCKHGSGMACERDVQRKECEKTVRPAKVPWGRTAYLKFE